MAAKQGRDQFVAWMHHTHPDMDVRSMRREQFGQYSDEYRDHLAHELVRADERARASDDATQSAGEDTPS
jgi:hypothetical protein